MFYQPSEMSSPQVARRPLPAEIILSKDIFSRLITHANPFHVLISSTILKNKTISAQAIRLQ